MIRAFSFKKVCRSSGRGYLFELEKELTTLRAVFADVAPDAEAGKSRPWPGRSGAAKSNRLTDSSWRLFQNWRPWGRLRVQILGSVEIRRSRSL